MRFTPVGIDGAMIVDVEPHVDDRGLFARTYCAREFEAHGLDAAVVQCSVSYNATRGTLRGLHSQTAPHEESKLVRCVRGAIHDVLVDTRRDSPTRHRHVAVELSAGNRRSLFIPKGVYHGFQTLRDDTEVLYQMSEYYVPDQGLGIRWDDPTFAIRWPLPVTVISPRDATYPDYEPT